MKILSLKLILVAALLSFSAKGQNSDFNENAEVVFFENPNLVKVLENVICDKNACSDKRKKVNWYVDFKNAETIIITQGRIANLIELNEGKERNIFATVVNDNIVFVLIGNEGVPLSKTGFSLDLSDFANKSTLAFEDFSAWLVKYRDGSYKLIESHIRKCD